MALPSKITEAQVIEACAALGLDYNGTDLVEVKIGVTTVVVKAETSYTLGEHHGVERREYYYLTAETAI